MHIILGALGSIVTILWLLHRLAEMGIDLGGLNPWLWRRRRNWRTLYEANPIFTIDKPLEATALLITAVAKADGVVSSKEKTTMISIFHNEFGLSKRDAAGLLISSDHLLGNGSEVRDNLPGVLKMSLPHFKPNQIDSAIELMNRISTADGPPSEMQRQLVDHAVEILKEVQKPDEKWG